jgi:hypothetical protein
MTAEPGRPTLKGNPTGFRLAYPHAPQFAVSVARIAPLSRPLEAVYACVLRQPRLRFLRSVEGFLANRDVLPEVSRQERLL